MSFRTSLRFLSTQKSFLASLILPFYLRVSNDRFPGRSVLHLNPRALSRNFSGKNLRRKESHFSLRNSTKIQKSGSTTYVNFSFFQRCGFLSRNFLCWVFFWWVLWLMTLFLQKTDVLPSFPSSIKLVTYNIWISEENREERIRSFVQILEKNHVDIFCVQETTPNAHKLLQENEYVRKHFFVSPLLGTNHTFFAFWFNFFTKIRIKLR